MSVTQDVSAPESLPRQAGLRGALGARMQGPGGYHNAGNLLCLATSLGLQVSAAAAAQRSGPDAIYHFLLGSPTAVGLTIAMTIFLVGGEVYYHAWRGRSSPDPLLNRAGDLLSALGNVVLAYSLLQIGQPVLALISGCMVIMGKLGSAILGDGAKVPGWPARWGDPFRLVALAGRVPAIAAACADFVLQAGLVLDGRTAGPLIQAGTLIVCQALWIRADLLLLDGGRKAARAAQVRS